MFPDRTVYHPADAIVAGENIPNPLLNLVSPFPWEELKTWVAAAGLGEDRVEAMRRIEFCEQYRTPLLDLSCLGLTALPAQIGKLVWLKQLDIASNQIAKLPEELGGLVKLTDLWCAGNLISDLPANLVALRDLQTLDCRDCQFSRLPTVLESLTPKCRASFACNERLDSDSASEFAKSLSDQQVGPQIILDDDPYVFASAPPEMG